MCEVEFGFSLNVLRTWKIKCNKNESELIINLTQRETQKYSTSYIINGAVTRIKLPKLKYLVSGAKLWGEDGAKLHQVGAKLLQEGAKLLQDGAKLYPDGAKLYQDGAKLYQDGAKLWQEGAKLFQPGFRLYRRVMLY